MWEEGARETYGPRRRKLGSHPLNIHPGPSRYEIFLINRRTGCFCADVITLVLITSIGPVTVAAVNPARKDAVNCVGTPSPMGVCSCKMHFATS